MIKKWVEENKISSYYEYLVKLKEVFGMPKEMPMTHQIAEFIEEYNLGKNWKIDVADVSTDLEAIINGRYDEMLKDSLHNNGHRGYQSARKPLNSYKPVVSSSRYVYQSGQCCSTYTYSLSVMREEKNWPIQKKKNSKQRKKVEFKREKTIFLDGDNHFDVGQKGIKNIPKNITVKAVFSQPGAKHKFDRKYEDRPNVSSKLVKPGDQAVDNWIKSNAGQLLKKGHQDVAFISQDKGYKKYKDRKQNEQNGNKIYVAKSVEEILKTDFCKLFES